MTRQPFKQVFRELYVPTDTERSVGNASRRYEGHQLQSRQAHALFGAKGWTADRESGELWRMFHHHAIAVLIGAVLILAFYIAAGGSGDSLP